MSMTIDVRINGQVIGSAEIVNRTCRIGIDAVNTYRWSYSGDANRVLYDTTEHRYGDGAVVLASKVLAEIALRYEIAAEYQKGLR